MSALLINTPSAGSGLGQRAAGPAPATLESDGPSGVLHFGETLRAHTSESPTRPSGRASGGLLATRPADAELQIDDADILRQLTNTNAAAVARTRLATGAKDAPSDDANATGDESVAAVSPVPIALATSGAPQAPEVGASNSATGANGAGGIDVAAGTAMAGAGAAASGAAAAAREARTVPLVAPEASARRVVVGSNAAAPFSNVAGETSLRSVVSHPAAAPATRASDAALIAMNSTAGGDPQGSNILVSQSQPLFVALADATNQKTAGTDKVADTQLPATSRPGLVDALGERLSVQLNRGSSQATLRLDPPMMGTIEIVIRHDAAGVQVHLSASHGDVLRQLHGIGNALTQDLVQRNHGDVTVHVSEGSPEGDGRQRNRQGDSADGDSTPGHALRMADEPERATAFTLA
jgi:flagellar hook-length control protein FliK